MCGQDLMKEKTKMTSSFRVFKLAIIFTVVVIAVKTNAKEDFCEKNFKEKGEFRDPYNCRKFHKCDHGKTTKTSLCRSESSQYSLRMKFCYHSFHVNCVSRTPPEKATEKYMQDHHDKHYCKDKKNGFHKVLGSRCEKYYECNDGKVLKYEICPKGMLFNLRKGECDDERKVTCRETRNCQRLVCYSDYKNILDKTGCTHLVYTHFKIEHGKLKAYSKKSEDLMRSAYRMRRLDTNLKIMISVGGRHKRFDDLNKMLRGTWPERKKFIDSVIEYLIKNKLDGLELDLWNSGTKVVKGDGGLFTRFVSDLHYTFRPYSFLLSLAVQPVKRHISNIYNVPVLSSLVDFINLRAWDLSQFTESGTPQHFAPLFHRKLKSETDIDHFVNYWLSQGSVREKVVIGMTLLVREGRNTWLSWPYFCNNLNNKNIEKCGDVYKGFYLKASNGQKYQFLTKESMKEIVKYSIRYKLGGVAIHTVQKINQVGTLEGMCRTGSQSVLSVIMSECQK